VGRPARPQKDDAAKTKTLADAPSESDEVESEMLEKAEFGEKDTPTALKAAPALGPVDTESVSDDE
jgi:hypothetical protein